MHTFGGITTDSRARSSTNPRTGADGIAVDDFAVTAADAQLEAIAPSAPALSVSQADIDALLSSVIDYSHRQIVIAHLLDYSQAHYFF